MKHNMRLLKHHPPPHHVLHHHETNSNLKVTDQQPLNVTQNNLHSQIILVLALIHNRDNGGVLTDVWGSVGAAAEFIAQNLGAYCVVWQAYGREMAL
jgi:hypothetical protein